ncbi:MAG: thioredoxin domain-containing protein [Planctomycetota bacterium]|nr:MAG: thioredoxin domain-containing protein [Planctomycetota bacterium]
MTDPNQPSTNRLAGETSPYLLQHAGNPVDWYPWGPEALGRARDEGKPIFLSIGYSACHWCHVMERESFENERIAALMNEHFVNVKVDREERPDLDEIYMKAVMRMTGAGGWPMSVFLTPELEPFFGGTYFPAFRAYGRPGFADVLASLAHAWANDPDKLKRTAGTLAAEIAREGSVDTGGELDPSTLDRSLALLGQSFDPTWGGFGDAPKFPHAMDIRLLLRHWRRTRAEEPKHMALFTLAKMADGGLYDQLGGGFHRYSTDERWLIPHFEKMLYDNALLVPAYLEAHLVTGEERFARVARECCEWALREMVTEGGGFASTQDADSGGEEGAFFAWTPEELAEVLGAQLGAWAEEWYGVTSEGNFEHGSSALWRPEPAAEVARRLGVPVAELEEAMRGARASLFAARERRLHPATDDKVLCAWNGLMISALALSHQVLGAPETLAAAARAARTVLTGMRQPDGRLFATARGGRAHGNACLDDYAFMIQGLVDLYESDFDPDWLRAALALERIVEEQFVDARNGGYFTTGAEHETLIARLKNPHDGALPSGNGVHALNLLRLAELTGDGRLAKRAERTIRALGQLVNRHPAAFSQLLAAVDHLAAGPREIVVAGDPQDDLVRAMLAEVRGTFLPQRVVALAHEGADESLVPLLEGREPGPNGARAYVCRNFTCEAPVETVAALARALAD